MRICGIERRKQEAALRGHSDIITTDAITNDRNILLLALKKALQEYEH